MSKYSFNFKGRKSQFLGVLKVKLNPASVGKLLKELFLLPSNIIFFLSVHSLNHIFVSELMWTSAQLQRERWGGCGESTCIHVIRPAAGLRAAACRRGTAGVEDIVHRALHLTVVNGLTLVGAERSFFPDCGTPRRARGCEGPFNAACGFN